MPLSPHLHPTGLCQASESGTCSDTQPQPTNKMSPLFPAVLFSRLFSSLDPVPMTASGQPAPVDPPKPPKREAIDPIPTDDVDVLPRFSRCLQFFWFLFPMLGFFSIRDRSPRSHQQGLFSLLARIGLSPPKQALSFTFYVFSLFDSLCAFSFPLCALDQHFGLADVSSLERCGLVSTSPFACFCE